jgi:hypothetical protein
MIGKLLKNQTIILVLINNVWNEKEFNNSSLNTDVIELLNAGYTIKLKTLPEG